MPEMETGGSAAEMPRIAMIGFGEAGQAFASGWREDNRHNTIQAWDLKLEAPADGGMRQAMARLGVVPAGAPAEALAGAAMVFCLVTADRAAEAARDYAPFLVPGALWLDGNSCAPDTKREAARAVEAAGGHYVDVAIMAPVHPRRHRTPILLAGAAAGQAASAMEALGMQVSVAGPVVGDASTIKMLRSVMIKGLEALVAECFLAARTAGVEEAILASLAASDPGIDWRKRSSYNLERMMVHGRRRAAEMREVVTTVSALGLSPRMSSAIADWQQQIGDLGLAGGDESLAGRSDRILAALGAALAPTE
jgi:3-hydroxyisobutyrate dehydrogenase-like beta-hydroxyacid dehydrogenase